MVLAMATGLWDTLNRGSVHGRLRAAQVWFDHRALRSKPAAIVAPTHRLDEGVEYSAARHLQQVRVLGGFVWIVAAVE